MNKTLIAMMTILSFATARNSFAYDAKYFEVDENSIKIEEIKDLTRGGTIKPGETIPLNPGATNQPTVPSPIELPKPPTGPQINPPNTGGNGTGTGVDWTGINNGLDVADKIVNLVEKIWGIIEKNQPVVNITTNYANAVPFGTSHWTQLQGWSKPATKRYSFSMKNGYGTDVVKVTYQVHYTYNGNFQGKGKFLTGVTVEPLDVQTLWGYKVSLTAEVPDSTIANVGTHEDPIASMQVQLKWTVHTVIKDIQSKAIYYVQGDGLIQEIGTPFKNAAAEKTARQVEKINNMTSVQF